MAKKILGDDPFGGNALGGSQGQPGSSRATPGGKTKGKGSTKAKRAPSRKTEAPRETRTVNGGAKKTAAVRALPAAPVVAPVIPEVAGEPRVLETVLPASSVAVALTRSEPSSSETPADAAPGSWRWWRSRQLQLARTEEHAWLARNPGVIKADRFGRDPVLTGRAEPIVDLWYRSWLRVTVRGLGHVPETGRAILVAKRRRTAGVGLAALALSPLARFGLPAAWSATLDAAVITHAVHAEHVAHREVRPLVKPARLYTPILGSLLRRLGGVPAELHDFARLLDDERLALAFVDDATPRADALDLSTIVCLALVTGAPIIPIAISTSRVEGSLLRPQRSTRLSFGTPLYPGAEFGPEGAEDEALVARLAAELAAQL